MNLDRIDLALLEALQNDARLSNKELAARVELAPSSCLERVRKLQREGVLQGAHAVVDARALGGEVEALVFLKLRQHTRDVVEAFRSAMIACSEVAAVYCISGAHDMMLHVHVTGTQRLRDFSLDKLAAHDLVVGIETSLVFEKASHPVSPLLRAVSDAS